MRPLLCLLLLTSCAVPTEPRVVQRQALQTMAPLDERNPTTTTLDCRIREVWGTLVVDGVRYIEILYVADC